MALPTNSWLGAVLCGGVVDLSHSSGCPRPGGLREGLPHDKGCLLRPQDVAPDRAQEEIRVLLSAHRVCNGGGRGAEGGARLRCRSVCTNYSALFWREAWWIGRPQYFSPLCGVPAASRVMPLPSEGGEVPIWRAMNIGGPLLFFFVSFACRCRPSPTVGGMAWGMAAVPCTWLYVFGPPPWLLDGGYRFFGRGRGCFLFYL